MKRLIILAAAMPIASCNGVSALESTLQRAAEPFAAASQVQTSGKKETPIAQVPAGVIAAVRAREPGSRLVSAESETRDGRRYFDIGGTLGDGSEIEFDVMEEGGRWRVVETQRDIPFTAVPDGVRKAALSHDPALVPTRVIESRQEDGVIIFELFSAAGNDPQGRKLEVRWDGREASVLRQEWAH